jgi:LysM repeat protein
MTLEDMDDDNIETVEETPAPEGPSNRTFFIVAGVLGGILLLALLCLALYTLFYAPQQRNQQATQVAEINAQNTQVALAVTQTSEAAAWTATPSRTPTASKTIVYVVREGDTLESIARLFGVTVEELLALNQKPNVTIQPGEEVQIPDRGQIRSTTIVYVVREGETLESIARLFGVTVAELMALNQKPNITVQPGEEILIPDRGQISTTPTPVLAAPGASPTADRTATVAFLLTEAAIGRLTVTPTASGLPATGFAEDVGVPGMVGLALVLIVVVFLARRLRTAS